MYVLAVIEVMTMSGHLSNIDEIVYTVYSRCTQFEGAIVFMGFPN